jgi:hypothetical protein
MTAIQLYCIECEKMVWADTHLSGHEVVTCPNSFDPPEVDYCEFPDGWAVMPPPDVDIDEFINTIAEPSDEEIARVDVG